MFSWNDRRLLKCHAIALPSPAKIEKQCWTWFDAKIQVFDHGNRSTEAGYIVGAIAEPADIEKLKKAGYRVQQHEDVDKTGKDRQQEVGRGDQVITDVVHVNLCANDSREDLPCPT